LYKTWKSRTAVLAVAATMAVPALAIAGPARAAGNNDNAQACQQGGWQYWLRADQTPFSNQGDCVSYAAHGGTLTAPLPDLVPDLACSVTSGVVGCTLGVKNVGAGPATGVVAVTFNGTGIPSGSGTFDFGPSLAVDLGTLAPGDTQAAAGVADADWTGVSVHVSIDTGNAIAESSETNNSLDQTFTF